MQRLETKKAIASNPKCEIVVDMLSYKPNTTFVRAVCLQCVCVCACVRACRQHAVCMRVNVRHACVWRAVCVRAVFAARAVCVRAFARAPASPPALAASLGIP